MILNNVQRSIVNMINIPHPYVTEDHQRYLNKFSYIREFLTYKFSIPRQSGKTRLIGYLAEKSPAPIIIFRNYSLLNDFTRVHPQLRPFCFTASTFLNEDSRKSLRNSHIFFDEVDEVNVDKCLINIIQNTPSKVYPQYVLALKT